ncbi:MAG: hypothetical protein AABX13_03530 [Nanoarchaeota archaeon]
MTKTSLFTAAKRALRSTILAVAACAPTLAYVPPDDYEQYPEYKKESALYKIGRIFDEVCSEMRLTGEKKDYEVSPARLSCRQMHCTAYAAGMQADPLRPGQFTYVKECHGSLKPLEFNLLWSEIVNPHLVTCESGDLSCLKLSADSSRDHDFEAYGPEQAAGLLKAIQVYLTP